MGDDEGARSEIEVIEARLRALRTIALAQSRWREVAAAVAAGTPLPVDGLTPDQERAVLDLQLRRLSPQDRERVRAEIDALEAALRRLTSNDVIAPESDRPTPDEGAERAPEEAPRTRDGSPSRPCQGPSSVRDAGPRQDGRGHGSAVRSTRSA